MAKEAVYTKIKAKRSVIFSEDKLDRILECDTIDQVTDFLKSRYDLDIIIKDQGIHHSLYRDDLETLLKRYSVREIEHILHYFSGPYKDFIKVFLMRFEISDLVTILRKIAGNEKLSGVEENFVHSSKFTSLNYEKLAASKSVAQFMENLKHTAYYSILKTVSESDVVKREFHMEMKLELLYFRTLLKRAEKLDPDDQKAVNEIIGTRIDFLNVQWIYRAKRYYSMSPGQILMYTLHGGRRLNFARVKVLCYAESVDDVRQFADKFLRCEIFSSGKDIEILKNMEKCMAVYLNGRKNMLSVGMVLAYIYMLELVMKNLISVTEGIRYKLPKECIRSYLVRPGRGTRGGQKNGD